MPATLDISLDRSPAAYRPGERLDGRARWDNADGIRTATVRLFWTTSGKGTTDTSVVAEQALATPNPRDERTFSFTLPASPPGFSGSLITLTWGVELVLDPGESAVHREFILGPDAIEIRLPKVVADPAAKKAWWKSMPK
jgi:hypothetical protein